MHTNLLSKLKLSDFFKIKHRGCKDSASAEST